MFEDNSTNGSDSRRGNRAGQMGSHPVSIPPPSQNRNDYQRPRETYPNYQHYPRPPPSPITNHSSDHRECLRRSKKFKQLLLQSIDLLVGQIHEWCPDEEGFDPMDWQPETTTWFPPPAETVFNPGQDTFRPAGDEAHALQMAFLETHMNPSLHTPLGPRAMRTEPALGLQNMYVPSGESMAVG